MGNNITQNKLCFGCRACEQICGRNVIEMIENKEGFLYASVNNQLCVDCGLCLKVCPTMHADELKHKHSDVFAAQVKDKQILEKSSSGGMFSVISKYVFDKKGVVFGAAYDKNLNLYHIMATSEAELEKMRGSKYFQSDTANTYHEVKNILKNGRLVYYTGTPCQIAGLRLFLKKEYSNLITSDLICHGTPSSKMFHLFLNQMEKERFCKITDYKFRDKRKGWGCSSSSSSSVRFNIWHSEINKDYNMEAYFNAFINGHITRMDCYKCKFCTPERVGDITIADYWGIQEQHPEFPGNYKLGVSLVCINTETGKNIWNAIKDNVQYCESSVSNVMQTDNKNFYRPTPFPKERETAYDDAFLDFKIFRAKYMCEGWIKYTLRNIYHKFVK